MDFALIPATSNFRLVGSFYNDRHEAAWQISANSTANCRLEGQIAEPSWKNRDRGSKIGKSERGSIWPEKIGIFREIGMSGKSGIAPLRGLVTTEKVYDYKQNKVPRTMFTWEWAPKSQRSLQSWPGPRGGRYALTHTQESWHDSVTWKYFCVRLNTTCRISSTKPKNKFQYDKQRIHGRSNQTLEE